MVVHTLCAAHWMPFDSASHHYDMPSLMQFFASCKLCSILYIVQYTCPPVEHTVLASHACHMAVACHVRDEGLNYRPASASRSHAYRMYVYVQHLTVVCRRQLSAESVSIAAAAQGWRLTLKTALIIND